MSRNQRQFAFEGSDNDYIAFLETRLSAALNQGTSRSFTGSATSLCSAPATATQPIASTTLVATSADSQPTGDRNRCAVIRASCPPSTRSAGSPPLSTGHDLRILHYDPIRDCNSDLPGSSLSTLPLFKQTSIVEVQGMKELRNFIDDLRGDSRWGNKKKELGLSRPEINKNTIKALCGQPVNSSLRESNLYPNEYPKEPSPLIIRGCNYGAITKDTKLKGNLLLHIAKYQKLIFVSLCVVMIGVGTPTDTVDWIMRRYISDTSRSNLQRLRSGCKWVNRCMSKLLETWGFLSWEAFFLCWYSYPEYLLDADYLKFPGLSNNTEDLRTRKTATKPLQRIWVHLRWHIL
jgi:hypothetical protein